VDYGTSARLHLAVRADEPDRLPRLLSELTGGGVLPEPAGSLWADA
jgi:hypothetical protein